MKNKFLLVVLVFVLILPCYGAVNVVTEKIRKGELRETLQFSGEVKPVVESFVTADVNGRVEKILVENGMQVKAGAPIILLENDRFKIALAQAEAVLKMAQQKVKETFRDFQRNKLLAERKVVNDKVFDISETNYVNAQSSEKQARAAFDLTALNLERAGIKAPISGFFVNRNVFLGQGVSQGLILGKIIDLTKVFVETKISENNIFRIKEGQDCTIYGHTADERFKGKVAFIDLYADNSRSFLAAILLENPKLAFKANMFVKGEIVFEHFKEVPLLPLTAVVNENEQNFVFFAEDGKARKQKIEIIAQEGKWAYANGLKEGDCLVVVGQSNLHDGAEILTQDSNK